MFSNKKKFIFVIDVNSWNNQKLIFKEQTKYFLKNQILIQQRKKNILKIYPDGKLLAF